MDSSKELLPEVGCADSVLETGSVQEPSSVSEERQQQQQQTLHSRLMQQRRKASRADDVQWGEAATNFFIDAFEQRYVEINRGNFRGKDWENLAAVVSTRFAEEGKRFSAFQCKHKLENLKKKYRREKTTMQVAGMVGSSWQWYNRMNHLFGQAPTKVSGIAGAVDNGGQEEVERPRKDDMAALEVQLSEEPQGIASFSPQRDPGMSAGTPLGSLGLGAKRVIKKKRRSSMFSPAKDLAASFREYAQAMAEVEREKVHILRALLAHHNIIVQPSTHSEP